MVAALVKHYRRLNTKQPLVDTRQLKAWMCTRRIAARRNGPAPFKQPAPMPTRNKADILAPAPDYPPIPCPALPCPALIRKETRPGLRFGLSGLFACGISSSSCRRGRRTVQIDDATWRRVCLVASPVAAPKTRCPWLQQSRSMTKTAHALWNSRR